MTTDTTINPSPTGIVVGIDGSDSSKEALRWAAFQAKALACEIVAVWAWQSASAVAGPGAGWVSFPTDWNPEADAHAALNATLDEVLGASRPAGVTTLAVEGPAAHALIEISRNARMLVLGSRGHGGFVGLLLGSVSTACAEHASCPVLVVHGKQAPGSA